MSTMPSRGLLLATALVTCLLVPSAAGAKVPNPTSTKIVLGKSVAGVKLDMTKKQVFAKWGKGSCLSADICEWQAKKPTFSGQYERAVVSFINGKAWNIGIQAAFTKTAGKLKPGPLALWKTSKGIHLGSKKSAVTKAYGAAKLIGGSAASWNLFTGSGKNRSITGIGTRGFGASPTLVSSITVSWVPCHFDPSVSC
jgi:hypothetical protein